VTYELIPGDPIWIVSRASNYTGRNPVFVLASNDGRFARQILAHLNSQPARKEGEAEKASAVAPATRT
jgi:hypothetical protein